MCLARSYSLDDIISQAYDENDDYTNNEQTKKKKRRQNIDQTNLRNDRQYFDRRVSHPHDSLFIYHY
jgi:hypothetical protein